MNEKLYIAGPDIFRKNAVEFCQWQRDVCRQHGFVPLHPLDNNVDLSENTRTTAKKIYWGDEAQMREADIYVANCNLFRGCCVDDGTSYEIGFGHALGKLVYGYIDSLAALTVKSPSQYDFSPTAENPDMLIDRDGFLLVDDFGTAVNLMIHEGIEETGGKLIEGNFEDAIEQLRNDIDAGLVRV